MFDQADRLRSLVQASAKPSQVGPMPRLVAYTSGKGGVGVTTTAVNVAVALSRFGHRTVLIDGVQQRGDVAPLCGLREGQTVDDVIASRASIHEALQPGPCGVHVLPGGWAPEEAESWSVGEMHRLLNRIGTLGRYADLVLLDLGTLRPPTEALLNHIDELLIVTTPDSVAVMDTYATVKTHLAPLTAELSVIINQVADEQVARELFDRLHQSCHRFLQREIHLAGSVPIDHHIPQAAEQQTPVLAQTPTASSSRAYERLAARLVASHEPSSRNAAQMPVVA